MLQFTVDLRGATQALRALKTLEPEVAKEVGRDLSNAGRTLAQAITAAAPKEAPVSGWTGNGRWPAWSPIKASSRRNGMKLLVSTSSAGPIAHMAEYIGNATKIKTADGQRLSDMFNQRLGTTVNPGGKRAAAGRLGVKAIGDQWGQIKQQIDDAVEKAVSAVNRRMP